MAVRKPMGAAPNEELRLIALARDGDVEAFTALVELHQDRVINVIFRALNDRETARDLAQEVFLQAWKTIQRFDDRAKFSTWLYRVAMNAVVSHLRYQSAQKRGGNAKELSLHVSEDFTLDPSHDRRLSSAPESQPDAALLAAEGEREIVAAIQGLDAEMRDAVVLRDVEGLSYEQIAEVLEINVGTVRSRLHRGREKLRERLSHLMDD